MQTMRLDQDQVRFYKDNGYLLYRQPVLKPEKFDRLCALFEEIVAANPNVRPDSLDVPHFREPRLFEFLMDDDVLDLVEPLIGPNIGLWSSHFISKEPGTGRRTPWHEDSAYWNGRFDKFTGIVTVWLAIDRCDRENGCMKVIPGSHRNGFSNYYPVDHSNNLFGLEIKADELDEGRAVYFELEPNQCSFHDSRLIHGADPNTSNRRRCGYTMRYFSQDMRFVPEKNPNHRLWHCRGENVAGNPVENR